MTDITGDIGPLYRGTETPISQMYSFERPSWLFWQGVYDGLTEPGGMTHEQAIDWLQSKAARWLLDASGDEIQQLGHKLGLKERNA